MASVVFDFTGKIALVTGAGRGIGRATAKALYAAGAITHAIAKTQANLDSLKVECPNIHLICVDLSDWEATKKAVEAVGPIDLLVNNAGIGVLQSFLDVDSSTFDKTVAVNVKAVIAVSQVVAKGLIERHTAGSIVNVSSISAFRALPDHTVYCASKGALEQVTHCMALELGPHNIRVNCVNPTVVMTDMGRSSWSAPERGGPMLARHPMHKFAEEEDVVNAILFLLSDKAGMIHGASLPVDGGFLVQ